MGLDAVEIVMEVEDRFKLDLHDDDAGAVRTVEDLAKVVWLHLNPHDINCTSAISFYQIRGLIIEQLGVDRRAVRPRTGLESLLVGINARRFWRGLKQQRPSTPDLELPDDHRVRCAMVGAFAGAIGACAFVPASVIMGTPTIVSIVIASLIAAACFGIATSFYTERVGEIPAGCATVGGLAKRTAPVYTRSSRAPDGLSYEKVLLEIRRITAEQMAIDLDDVTPGSRFVQDLGVS